MMKAETPLLEVCNVKKTFDGSVEALKGVSISVFPSEVLGIVGENGAGKSTLMKILAGIFPPDSGEIFYRGVPISFPRNPKEAVRMGIALVPQEQGVVPHLKVYQFALLGHEEKFSTVFGLKKKEMKSVVREILKELKIDCDVDSYMYELSLSTRKLVEIAKAFLSINLECEEERYPIIILDEPTAPLAIEQRENLFEFIMESKRTASFIFVSHIIPEILNFADRVYVLRDGMLIAHHDLRKEALTEEDLFREIVGRSSSEYMRRSALKKVQREREEILNVQNISKRGCYYNISFTLHRGECLGLFGASGSGKADILHTLAGIQDFDEGIIRVEGKVIKKGEAPYVRLEKYGIGYFSGETGKELFLNWSVARNISTLNLEKVTNYFVIDSRKEEEIATRVVKRLRIKCPSVHTECYSLSGGNKQKVSVGKWMEKSPKILLLEDPTIGIDVGAREDIYDALLEMKEKCISMILVSDDPKEYLLLCDRVLYIKGGRVEKELLPEELEVIMKEE